MTDTLPGQIGAPSVSHVRLDSANSWRRLVYAVLIGLISNASLWTAVALMPSLQGQFEITRTEASYPYIAIMAGFLIASPALGRLSDRHGIARVLFFASFIGSLGYIAGSFAQSFPAFLMCQVIVGIGTAAGFAPLAADISHWFRRHRGLAVAIVSSTGYISGIIWSTVIAQVLHQGSWRDVHLIIGIAVLAIAPLSYLLRRRVPNAFLDEADRRSKSRSGTARLPASAVKWLLAIAGVSCCIAMAMPQVHLVSFCVDLGLTIRQGNDLLSTMLLGGIVSRIVSGAIIDRVGAARILMIGSALQMLALSLYIPFDGLASLYVVSLVFGLAQGGILPSYPIIVRDYLPARSAGAAIGFVATATQFGMAFGGWLSGWIFDQTGSYFMAFFNGIAFNAVNLILVGFLIFATRPLAGKAGRTKLDA
jgi:MFS family permease